MDLEVSPIFVKNLNANKRYVVNQGGMRSGKTYSILQVLIIKYLLRHRGLVVDIARKTQAELRGTVIVDFFKILEDLPGIKNPPVQTKTGLEYKLNGNLIRFIGLDKAQKKRGAGRDILYINEANGLTLEDWVQLSGRCRGQIYIDFNPSEHFWVNDLILEKSEEKFDLIHSTYLDNYDFLPKWQIEEIENLINIDDFYYKVYVLGMLAIMKGKIFTGYEIIEDYIYDELFEDETFYGLDFGYEHATSLIEIKYADEKVYERERYHETHKHVEHLIEWMEDNGISKSAAIYADPAVPASIRKIQAAGFNVHKAKKDVKDGLMFCQALKRSICKSSTHHIRSMGKYKFKQTASGEILDWEPVKIEDDSCDAMRYGEFTHLRKQIITIGMSSQ